MPFPPPKPTRAGDWRTQGSAISAWILCGDNVSDRDLPTVQVQTRWAKVTCSLDKVYGVFSLASVADSLGDRYSGEVNNTIWNPFRVDYNFLGKDVSMEITRQ